MPLLDGCAGARFNKDCSYAFVIPSQRESIFVGNCGKVDSSRCPIRPNFVQFNCVYETVVTSVSPEFPSDAVGQFPFRHSKNRFVPKMLR
jgi:hypothetical protein